MSGDFEEIPLDPITDDKNDGDGDDDTQSLPGPTSTPYPEGEQTETPTLPREQSGLPNTSFNKDMSDLN